MDLSRRGSLCRHTFDPIHNRIQLWFQGLRGIVCEGFEFFVVQAVHPDKHRDIKGQRVADHRAKSTPVRLVLAELVDDQQLRARPPTRR